MWTIRLRSASRQRSENGDVSPSQAKEYLDAEVLPFFYSSTSKLGFRAVKNNPSLLDSTNSSGSSSGLGEVGVLRNVDVTQASERQPMRDYASMWWVVWLRARLSSL
jgi:hypothetical protein